MTRTLAALLVLGACGAALRPLRRRAYPSRTITIVSPAPAGGVTDTIGRALAQRFSKAWGQQAVVENKPGANNQLAAEYIANRRPTATRCSSRRTARSSPIRASIRSCLTIPTRASRRSAAW